MTGLPFALASGFVLGMRHATEADHVVAVTTIVARSRSVLAAARVGALWGLGHTLTILGLGGAIAIFGLALPPHVGLALELCVALMLLGLGAANVAIGVAGRDASHARAQSLSSPRSLRSLAIGCVHGLAGSAAVTLMIVPTMRSASLALAYLATFGVGTVAGMMLVTSAMSMPMRAVAGRFGTLHRHLGLASGLLSVGLGLVLAYQIGIVDGLFSEHPHWQPR
jgi:high-affinity nickel-transport protein